MVLRTVNPAPFCIYRILGAVAPIISNTMQYAKITHCKNVQNADFFLL